MGSFRSQSFQGGTPLNMNYQQSEKILSEIKKAKKILVNCHRSPDADSVGSSLSMYSALLAMGKEVKVVCPDNLGDDLKFLPFSDKVEKIDFSKFDFSVFDLLLILDSGSVNMVTKKKDVVLPKIRTVVIDHHITNEKFGDINLVKSDVSSTAEIIYLLFEDWEVLIEKEIAQNLLAGIIADTGVFEFPNVTTRTLAIAQKLMEKGGDREEIIFNIFKSVPFEKIKFWGEIIRRMEFDSEHKFVWSAVSNATFKELGAPVSAKESAATIFAPAVKDTDFGMVMVEEEKGILSISLRGRTDFDVSKIAKKLGGGGHISAAGAKVYEKDFDTAVIKVLETARKVVNENKSE